MKKKIILLIIFSICIFCNCIFVDNEMVMINGMVIEATNDFGTIVIEAGKGLKRTYEWDKGHIKLALTSRWTRWYGSLGAYLPGSSGNIYAILEEGQQHFNSQDEVTAWLEWQNDRLRYVYSSDGLVVGWRLSPGPGLLTTSLTVEVWQIYIRGQKPVDLDGARDDLIDVSYLQNNLKELPLPGKFFPSRPQMINGRYYAGKALDYMKEQKITADEVEICIRRGELIPNDKYKVFYTSNPFVITWIDDDGKVVLVTG